jgi:hypothetical protein
MSAVLSEPMQRMLDYLESHDNDGQNWKLHYVSARESYKIIKAAEAGLMGEAGAYPDFLIS